MSENQGVKFRIERVLIIDSHLTRESNMSPTNDTNNLMNIRVGTGDIKDDHFGVEVGVEIIGMQDEKTAFTIKATAIGLFEKIGNPSNDLSIDQFKNINAPAIIFPFIREHVASLGQKAGLGNIILQPVNFVNFNKNQKKQEVSEKPKK